jgi:general transcription factor 3C polypeptide 3 (transcription factor C subunit 4)
MVNEGCRWFFKYYSFSRDSYRLSSATHRVVRSDHRMYTSGPEQKFYLRQIKAVDYIVLTPEERLEFYSAVSRNSTIARMKENYSGIKDVTKHDVDLLALYGHLMLVGRAAGTALYYYFRAFSLSPEDATLNLCISIAYFNWAWKRQANNRQYLIQQALCFLQRYVEFRKKTAKETKDDAILQEVEFNEGLVYAGLGLMHLAMPKFENCLELGRQLMQKPDKKPGKKGSKTKGKLQKIMPSKEGPAGPNKEIPELPESFTAEAAYAMRNTLALNGDFDAAHELTKKWLVL